MEEVYTGGMSTIRTRFFSKGIQSTCTLDHSNANSLDYLCNHGHVWTNSLSHKSVPPLDHDSCIQSLPKIRHLHWDFYGRGVMLAYYIPAVIVKIRICSPITKFWDQRIDGTCLDQTSIILADSVVSVVSDMIVLILPLLLNLTLQISTKRKMRVMAILGAGGLAVVASIIRLALIVITGCVYEN